MKTYGENMILKWTLKKENMEIRARSSSWYRENHDKIFKLLSKYNTPPPTWKKLAGLAKIKKMVRSFRNATGSFAQYVNVNQH